MIKQTYQQLLDELDRRNMTIESSEGWNIRDQDGSGAAGEAAAVKAGWPLSDVKESSPLLTQIGGNHYKDLAIQPAEYNHANGIPYMEGNVIKYVTRWRKKGGIKDLEKAKHYIELLIEMETKKDKQ